MSAASAPVCPVVGTTTTLLPPNHPEYNTEDPEASCPVTKAKVGHHGANVIVRHPEASSVSKSSAEGMDATACPALKNANKGDGLTNATCPVVGPVSAVLPPSHPAVDAADAAKVCPVTNATLEHHKNKVHVHPAVASDASAKGCPVAGNISN